MSKNHRKQVKNVTPEPIDSDTYQTGVAKPPKGNNGLVAVLLVSVIFLGGLASAMGFINIRLLSQMMKKPDSTIPLHIQTNPTETVKPDFIFPTEEEAPAPVIPDDRHITLRLNNSPVQPGNEYPITPPDTDEIYQSNADSMVSVYTFTYHNSSMAGSGLVISEDGYILTNAHLVESAKMIFIRLSDEKVCRASVVGADNFSDLAVLYIEADNLKPVEFGNSNAVLEGDPVCVLNSFSESSNILPLREGTYSGSVHMTNKDLSLNLLHCSVGSTWGPLFNRYGQVIGFNTGVIRKYFDLIIHETYGFSIPSTTIKEIVEQIIDNGFVSGRPCFGIEVEPISKLYQNYWGLPKGLWMTKIRTDSNAAQQGLQKGDILLALDGTQITSNVDLYTFLYSKNIGDKATAVILRNGQKMTVTLTIEEANAS